MGADGQVLGGVVMGVGLALSEGTMLDDQGRQRNPHLLDYKLVTCSDAPEIEVEWIEYDSVGPARLQGRRRAAAGADGRRDRERDLQGARRAGARAADDARARVGRDREAGA